MNSKIASSFCSTNATVLICTQECNHLYNGLMVIKAKHLHTLYANTVQRHMFGMTASQDRSTEIGTVYVCSISQ